MDTPIIKLSLIQISLLNKIVKVKDGLVIDSPYLVTAEALEKRLLIKWVDKESGIKRAKLTKLGARHALHYLQDLPDIINLLGFPPFGK